MQSPRVKRRGVSVRGNLSIQIRPQEKKQRARERDRAGWRFSPREHKQHTSHIGLNTSATSSKYTSGRNHPRQCSFCHASRNTLGAPLRSCAFPHSSWRKVRCSVRALQAGEPKNETLHTSGPSA